MDSGAVRAERDTAVLTLTLDRPGLHNALDHGMVSALGRAFADAATDPGVRLVVLRAAGKHFSAGVDLAKLSALAAMPLEESAADARAIAEMLAALTALDKPVLARVHGAVLGGALALVAACDIVVAAQSARFGAAEARLGLVPVLLTPYLAAAIGVRAARHYLLSCERMGAAEAHRLGLVQRVVPDEDLDAATAEMIKDVLLSAPGSVAATKRMLRDGAPLPRTDTACAAAAEALAHARATPEARAGVAAFLDKRAPPWVAAQPSRP